jgi:hypothetical protein
VVKTERLYQAVTLKMDEPKMTHPKATDPSAGESLGRHREAPPGRHRSLRALPKRRIMRCSFDELVATSWESAWQDEEGLYPR